MSDIKDWENTYKSKGVVQHEVLHTVQNSVNVLKRNSCKRVLDLGCGTGRHSIFLAKNNFDVYAVDISETAIDILKQRAKIENINNIHFKIADIYNTEFETNFFDSVLCVWSTGHGLKKDVYQSVLEMHRILKPGGVLLADFMSTEDYNYGRGQMLEDHTFLHNFLDHSDVPHHYSTEEEVKEMLIPFKKKIISKINYQDPKYNTVIKSWWVEAKK